MKPGTGIRPAAMALLREKTRDHHRRLDSHPRLRCLLSSELSRSRYADALYALYPAQRQVELLLAQCFRSQALDCETPPLLHGYIAQDLRQLNLEPQPIVLAQSEPRTRAELLGVLYVVEGSKLGAKHIHRSLAQRCPEWPLKFYAASAQASDVAWQRFSRLAEQELILESQQQEAVKGAIDTFELYHEALTWTETAPGYSASDTEVPITSE